MADNLKALVVILFLAGVVFLAARGPACQAAMAEEDFRRRRNLWLALTALVFLAQDFWLFMAGAAVLLLVLGRRDPNPPALFFFLVFAVPALASEISGFGLARQLFALSYPRLLALTVLLPAALALFLNPGPESSASKWPDRILAAYILLTLGLQLTVDTFTNTLRYGLYDGLDIVLPYYVASRALNSRKAFRDALMSFSVAAMVLAAIGVFEFAKSWLLYASLDNILGVGWAYGGYLQRGDSLRALASTGQPIALGFVMAVACGLFLYLRPAVASRGAWRLGLALLMAGLLAPVSRGPWLGAAVGFVAFVATGPRPLEDLSKLAFIGLLAAPLVLLSPIGDSLLEHLPFIGAEASDTVAYRERLLEMSLGIIRDNPLFGSFDFLRYLEDLRQGQGIIDIVNTYLGVALASGLVGLSLFVSFFLSIALGIRRALLAGADDDLHLLGRVLLATLAGILVIIFTVSSITVIPIVYWSVAGLGLAYIRLAERQRRPQPAPLPAAPPAVAGLQA
ncbi:MAG TPA: O-antigen ligase family protein [Rhodocyclaceae bacterium]|nr:O-antigen ligase family protein [Rhodocyclaceae bacterium]